MKDSGVLKNTVMCFGQMNEPPEVVLRVALTALTMAEYFPRQKGRTYCSLWITFSGLAKQGRSFHTPGKNPFCRGISTKSSNRDRCAPENYLYQERLNHVISGYLRSCWWLHRSSTCEPHLLTSYSAFHWIASYQSKQFYPAVDPLVFISKILEPAVVGEEHYNVLEVCKKFCNDTKELQDIIAIPLLMNSTQKTSSQLLAHAESKFLSQPFFVCQQFTSVPGKYVTIAETIRGFEIRRNSLTLRTRNKPSIWSGGIDDDRERKTI